MPAITSLSIFRAAPLARPFMALGAFVVRRAVRMARSVKNRHAARMLASLDDRMLADIGLTRSDLRDAYSEPLWQDPTDILARRAAERRGRRRRPAPERPAHASVKPPLMPAPHPVRHPPADRPACYLT